MSAKSKSKNTNGAFGKAGSTNRYHSVARAMKLNQSLFQKLMQNQSVFNDFLGQLMQLIETLEKNERTVPEWMLTKARKMVDAYNKPILSEQTPVIADPTE